MPILRAPARLYDWPALEAVAPDERWHPCVFERGDPEQREAMDALVARDRVTGVFDRHEAQLEELVRVRAPDRELSRAELSAELEALAAPGGRGRSGRWVYYPWSGRLVHVLEPARFREDPLFVQLRDSAHWDAATGEPRP